MQVTPAQLFAGYGFDVATGLISIPLASLPGLTAAEADVSGNGMEVLRQIIDTANTAIVVLAPAARPTKATIAKPNPSIASGLNVTPGTLRQTYNLTFDLQPTGLELALEA